MATSESGVTTQMPTIADYKGPDSTGYQKSLKSRLQGTDKWNDHILRAAIKTGVNPILLKVIMAIESGGNVNISNSNVGAQGLMQIMPSWGFNAAKLKSDPDYALECAAQVLKTKASENKARTAAQKNGGPSSIFNTARGYIGWGSGGVPYANQVGAMVEGFGVKRTTSLISGTKGGYTGTGSSNVDDLDTGLGGTDDYEDVQGGFTYEDAEEGADGTYDGPVFEGISGVYDKPSFVPPHYYEDHFKALPHRYAQGDYFMRIGDSRFVIPPTQISISETSNIVTSKTLRQKQSLKIQSGSNTRTISLTLMFTDFEQINGYEMMSGDGTKTTYYMDGLRSLIAQMKTMPFLPVENEYLNSVHDIYAVALLSCHVNVVPGFPGMLKAELTMTEFDPEPFLYKPAWLYDSHFVWPLYRWHYQRLISGRTKNIDTLADYIGDGVLNFWHLDERALAGHKEEVIAESDKELKEGDRYVSWWDFNAKLEKDINHNKLFKCHEIPPDYQIVDISGTFGNTLAPMTPSLTGRTVYQYFGSQDARFNVLLQTSSREVIFLMKELKDRLDRYAREYRNGFVSSMLRIENNFVNMLGVTGVLIESMNIQTIEGSPGEFYISLDMVSFDETQHVDEKLGHITTVDFESILNHENRGKEKETYKTPTGQGATAGSGGAGPKGDGKVKTELKPDLPDNLAAEMTGGTLQAFDNHIRHAVNAERELDKLELYPDLELPSPYEVRTVVRGLNKVRAERGLKLIPEGSDAGPIGAKFVDPDFYFSYPTLDELMATLEVDLKKDHIQRLAAEQGIDMTDEFIAQFKKFDVAKFFGEKTNDIISNHVDNKYLKDAFDEMDIDPKKSADQWSAMEAIVSDPARYTKRFWTKSWTGDGGKWKQSGTQVDQEKDNNWTRYYFEKQQARAVVQSLKDSERYQGMLHDMVKYDRRGTMMRAFPSYVLVLIDEGMFMNIHKLWDNYYTYHAVSEINVHMDRKNPIHTAYIKLSNIYGALENEGKFHHKLHTPTKGEVIGNFFKDVVGIHAVKERELLERTLVYDSILLLAGARIHIRAGYGSMASQLPVLFNGVISEIDSGDEVTVVAQSFGHEMTAEIPADPNEKTSLFKQGLEPTEMFRYYMSERKGNYTWAWRVTGEPEKYQSAYGIDHFGFLRVRDNQQFSDFFSFLHWNQERSINAEDYDIMKNIYSTVGYAKTGVDEGLVKGEVLPEDVKETSKFVSKKTAKDLYEANKQHMPKSQSWLKVKPNLESLKMNKPLKKLVSIKDAVTLVNAFKDMKKDTKAEREAIIHALLWWAANPASDSFWSGSKRDSHMYRTNSKSKVKPEVEDFLRVIEKVDEALYKQAVTAMTEVLTEWDSLTNKDNLGEAKTPLDMDENAKKPTVEEKLGADAPSSDEENVRMTVDGKSPWDVFRTIERVSPEYVVYPHVHQFHYTLFFGKPSWDVQCGYVLPPKEKTDKMYGRKISDYVELTKPFSQMHYYSSYGDIISNEIKVVGDNLITAVLPMYAINETDKTYDIAWADYYIRGSHQKTRTVDTTLVANIPVMPTWMESIGAWVGGLGKGTKYQKHSIKFAQGVIAESFRDMYQGELLVFGDPSVKPYDVMYIDDYNKKMTGTAEVGRVTHSLSVESGFYTSIKPDLAVVMNPEPNRDSADWASDPAIRSDGMFRIGEVASIGALMAIKYMSMYEMVKITTRNKAWARLASVARTSKAGAASVSFGTRWAMNAKGKLVPFTKNIKFVQLGVRKGVSTGVGALLRVATLGVLVPGPGWVASVVSISAFAASTILLKVVENMFVQRFNNVIKIFPLFSQEKPFVAGINGHRMLIPGWQDNGSGKPVRVSFDNVERLEPPTIQDIAPPESGLAGVTSGGTVDANGNMVANTGKVTAKPAEFLSKVPKSMIDSGAVKFCFPVALGSEGTGFAGLAKRFGDGFNVRWGKPGKHNGQDIRRGKPGQKNKAQYAICSGRVIYAQPLTSLGGFVFIEHTVPQGNQGATPYVFYTGYAHFYAGGIRVKAGQKVKAGTYLGEMGNTGFSFGEHQHIELMVSTKPSEAVKKPTGIGTVGWVRNVNGVNARYVDPMQFIKGLIAFKPDIVEYIPYKG